MATNFMGYTLWLMLNDEEFMRLNNIPANIFPRGSARFLADLATILWRDRSVLVDPVLLDMALEGDSAALKRNGADVAQVADAYLNIDSFAIPPASWPAARTRCRQWVEDRVLELTIARATKAYDEGRPEDARAHLGSGPVVARKQGASSLHINVLDIDVRKKSIPGAIPTGFAAIDKAWDGGYRPQDLGMIAAQTGLGKSMCLCYMSGVAYWHGANVLYFTYELSPNQIRERIMASMLAKSYGSIVDWQAELQLRAIQHYGLNAPPTGDIDIRNEPQTWPELLAALEEYKRDWGKYPDVLMMDSADDVAPPKEGRTQQHIELKDAYILMRDEIAGAREIRVWSSAQLNRGAVEKAHVNLKDIGDAFAKAQKSHYVLGFAQPEGMRNDPGGPKMMLYILKDSLWGTAHGRLEMRARFGHGRNGYAGYDVTDTWDMPQEKGGFDDPE